MNVTLHTTNNILILTIEGSIDSKTAGDLQNQIMDSVADAKNIIMNLSAVEFLSSAGLRILLMVYRQLKARNGKIILVGVSEDIRDVMEMTGFINFFEIHQTLEQAYTQF